MMSLILETLEIKEILESEEILNERVYYMTDKTSYSENQIYILKNKLILSDLICFLIKLKNEKMKKDYQTESDKIKEENKRLSDLFSDKKYMEKKWKEFIEKLE